MKVENISELQIWIEGQFALIAQSQNTTAEDVRAVRSRVHDLSNDVQRLLALDIEGKLHQLERADKGHDENIRNLTDDLSQRRGAMSVVRAIYIGVGGLIGAVVTLLLQGHPH